MSLMKSKYLNKIRDTNFRVDFEKNTEMLNFKAIYCLLMLRDILNEPIYLHL